MEKRSTWKGRRNQCRITVDNHELASILCGHSVLKAELLRPMCERITSILCRLYRGGWQPPGIGADQVISVPRELNKAADKVCNTIMDIRSGGILYSSRRTTTFLAERCNLKISSDGGSRGGKSSATGWAVWAVLVGGGGEEVRETLLAKGVEWCDRGMPSLEVETRALAEVLEYVVRLLG